jgi:hypothetical protein
MSRVKIKNNRTAAVKGIAVPGYFDALKLNCAQSWLFWAMGEGQWVTVRKTEALRLGWVDS